MPVMKREEWLKLSPRERVAHSVQRSIDRIDALQRRYDRLRASGNLSETIPFLERKPEKD